MLRFVAFTTPVRPARVSRKFVLLLMKLSMNNPGSSSYFTVIGEFKSEAAYAPPKFWADCFMDDFMIASSTTSM